MIRDKHGIPDMATNNTPDTPNEEYSPPAFILIKGESPVEWFLFGGDRLSIGRDPSNAIELESTTCSRVHAKIYTHGGNIIIEDCDSTNGTYVNKKKIKEPTVLQHLDRIYLGGTEWLLFIPEESFEPNPFLLIENVQQDFSKQSTAIVNKLQEKLKEEYDKEDTQERERIRLQRVIKLFGKLGGSDQLYDLLLEILFREFNFDRGVVLTQKPESGQLVPKSIRNTYAQKTIGRIAICRAALERVLSSGETLIVLDANQDQRFTGNFAVKVHGINTILCVPLQKRNEVQGLVYLDNREKHDDFGINEIKHAIAICEQAAVVIENSSLFREINVSGEYPSEREPVPIKKIEDRSRFVDYIPHSKIVHEELKTSYVKVGTLVEELLENEFSGSLLLSNEKKLCRGFCLFHKGLLVGSHINGIHFPKPLNGIEALESFWQVAQPADGTMTGKAADPEASAAVLPLLYEQKIYSNLLSEFIYVDRLLKIFSENKYTGCITGQVQLRRINGIVHVYGGKVIGCIVGGQHFPNESKPFSDIMNSEPALIDVYVLESRKWLEEDLLSQLPLSG